MYHLVLADDSQTIQKVVRLSFAGEDCAIHCFSNGAEALDYVKIASADVVLADADMPSPDGYTLCRELRSSPATSQIPLVLLTAAFVPLDREKAETVQYSGSISKPFEPNELVKLVKNLLEEPVTVEGLQEPEENEIVQEELDEMEFPSTFMSLPRPPVEGELLFELKPEQCQPYFQVLKRKKYSREATATEPESDSPRKKDSSNVDLLVQEVEERLRNSLRGIVSEVTREYLDPDIKNRASE